MKLNEIAHALGKTIETAHGEIEIEKLAFDTREDLYGSLYFCLSGGKTDGHNFLQLAKKSGAVAAVVERRQNVDLPQIVVSDSRHALAVVSKHYYGSACERLTIFAVTGTNGKTTVCSMLAHILESNGKSVGVIGTNGVFYGGKSFPSPLTTPDPPALHEIFSTLERNGITHVVMEASAHALALNKLDTIEFAAVGFTNLTRDHLDFFADMTAYEQAKLRLFSKTHAAAVNLDDPTGAKIFGSLSAEKVGYGFCAAAEIRAENLVHADFGSAFTLVTSTDKIPVTMNVYGKYNVSNALCAVSLATLAGISTRCAAASLAHYGGVDGRFNVINLPRGRAIVDYAHTDDGLKNLLSAVREITTGRIITVFGCGGNRDKEKRPLMGRAAALLSDAVIITSDNPRDEDATEIINDALVGIKEVEKAEYFIQPDRRAAIELAIKLLRESDVAVIAGKGAEKYQEIRGVKYPFDDRTVVEEAAKKC